jgi:hypothetical protein
MTHHQSESLPAFPSRLLSEGPEAETPFMPCHLFNYLRAGGHSSPITESQAYCLCQDVKHCHCTNVPGLGNASNRGKWHLLERTLNSKLNTEIGGSANPFSVFNKVPTHDGDRYFSVCTFYVRKRNWSSASRIVECPHNLHLVIEDAAPILTRSVCVHQPDGLPERRVE